MEAAKAGMGQSSILNIEVILGYWKGIIGYIMGLYWDIEVILGYWIRKWKLKAL